MKKKLVSISALFICLLAASSFKPSENIFYKDSGNVQVVVDGKIFDVRDKDKYRAQLLYRTAMTQGAGKTVMASLMFYGNTLTDDKGKTFDEKVDFDYAFNEGTLGEVANVKIELHHQNKDYYQIPDKSSFKVTKITWSADRRNYIMTAEFDCQMRQWGYPAESQPIARMKGKMENVNVTVPAWVTIKNPGQTASGE